ncbi:MAG: TIGR02147 family protein [Bdellovibrionota bacterium]
MQVDYTGVIRQKLQERVESNPGYSLRAFARNLGLDPGFLSHVLKGKRQLSVSRALELTGPLGLNTREKEHFLNLVQLKSARTDQMREEILTRMSKTRQPGAIKDIDLETFAFISDWYHNAILELTHRRSFKISAKSVASLLGITTLEAKLALERLVTLGLLTQTNLSFVKTASHFRTRGEVPNQALRKRHRQVLAKATDALDKQNVDRRDFQSFTMCIDPKLIPTAKQKIQRSLWDLCTFLESGDKAEVYEMSFQLFSLEQNKQEKKS